MHETILFIRPANCVYYICIVDANLYLYKSFLSYTELKKKIKYLELKYIEIFQILCIYFHIISRHIIIIFSPQYLFYIYKHLHHYFSH